ncbi:MAG TPA: hypothetical protein H9977_01765 [Candidatus Parabacteroides intestinipullorum]|uniref:Uncharacterized protein n=1 Tax=Candidatus Parabacteroides intestinipullorum TaxID=2838723 RepID=A0A9D2BFP7_9BACT|nr:hypothetical protein [Candidatus Parabacteroides intestinipullorum]
MKSMYYFLLCLSLGLFMTGCEEKEAGDIVEVGLSVDLRDAAGVRLLDDTVSFDVDDLDLAYLKEGTFVVYREASMTGDVGKGFEVVTDEEGVRSLSVDLDETACGLPDRFSLSEGALEGTFRFEYPGRQFPSVLFRIEVEKKADNRHIYLSAVEVEGQESVVNTTRGPVWIEVQEMH